MFQRSKNQDRAEILTGIKGCNAYCIVYDVKTELLFGITSKGKCLSSLAPSPLDSDCTPTSVSRRIIRMDLGGETGLNPNVQALLDRHGYISQPTGAGSSSQNGVAERLHQTISNAVRTMLTSAHLPPRYWEYEFYFFLRIHTILPHGTTRSPPITRRPRNNPIFPVCVLSAVGSMSLAPRNDSEKSRRTTSFAAVFWGMADP
jgi:hypothetical protein